MAEPSGAYARTDRFGAENEDSHSAPLEWLRCHPERLMAISLLTHRPPQDVGIGAPMIGFGADLIEILPPKSATP